MYDLAIGFTIRDPNAPPLTQEERKELVQYVARLEQFRTSTYSKIKPSPRCKPFVNDDNVTPPPKPLPSSR